MAPSHQDLQRLISGAGLTRRRFIAGGGAAAVASRSGLVRRLLAHAAHYPMPTYFTLGHGVPHTRSARMLANWLETEHFNYSLDSWFFFGRLVSDANPQDAAAFFIALQRLPYKIGGRLVRDVYGAGVGFAQRSPEGYEAATDSFPRSSRPDGVVVRPDPWRVDLYNRSAQAAPLMTMRALAGRMGEAGTVYRLSADIPKGYGDGPGPTGRLRAEVRVRDRFGAISNGYGTAAFAPQFVTVAQKKTILKRYGGSVQRYLERTRDPMTDQGSWYYQLPFLHVEQFSVMVGDTVRSKGTRGLLWMDGIVQSYNKQTYDYVLKESTYEFFAMQFPEESTALMVFHVDSPISGRFPVANLYNTRSKRTANGARKPVYSWPINGIEIKPDLGSRWQWRSPVSGNQYHLRYHVRLHSPHMSADLTVTMAFTDQEILERSEHGTGIYDYEGIGDVEGTLNGRRVQGQAFLEAVPAVG